jgi:hypothetical protein
MSGAVVTLARHEDFPAHAASLEARLAGGRDQQ